MKATFASSKQFLSKISPKDKVAIICDNDLDGYSSGILFYLFAKKQGAKVRSFVIDASKPQEGIINQLKKFNKIIIADLGANKITKILSSITNKNVFYTDHHPADDPVPKQILEYRTVKIGYIPSSRTAQQLTEGDKWRGLSGTLSDMGHRYPINNKYIKTALKELKRTQKKFLETVVFPSNKLIMFFYKNPQKAFQILAKTKDYTKIKSLSKYTKPVECEIQKYVRMYKRRNERLGKANYYSFNPKYPIKSTITTIISINNPHKILIFANPNKNKIKISARCQSKRVDVGKLLIEATKNMENAKAGGHANAAGTIFLRKDLKQFKKNITRLTQKL